jgi:pimeloyl-ACP methyl ester carboxylesterase
MSKVTIEMVQVQGAELYCKLRGRGPLLFMIAGGSGDADSFDSLTPYLEQDFTVLTYDRRGYARSPLIPDKGDTISILTQRTDAEVILGALSAEPAYVFGSSLGAVIGLDLLIHGSKHVLRLVAHEPPLVQLMPSDDTINLESRADEDPEVTLRRFAASLGIKRSSDKQASSPQRALNGKFFLEHEAPAVGRYIVNFTELKKFRDKLTFAGGEEGKEYLPYRCAHLAADQVKASFVEFPGKHNGFGQYPQKFAEKLLQILSD